MKTVGQMCSSHTSRTTPHCTDLPLAVCLNCVCCTEALREGGSFHPARDRKKVGVPQGPHQSPRPRTTSDTPHTLSRGFTRSPNKKNALMLNSLRSRCLSIQVTSGPHRLMLPQNGRERFFYFLQTRRTSRSLGGSQRSLCPRVTKVDGAQS